MTNAARRVMPDTPEARELRAKAAAVPFWWHSIDLGCGVTTLGKKSPEQLEAEVAALALTDFAGKSVLDIGAWDGFFSFLAEERGAARVVACDHFAWARDFSANEQKDRLTPDWRSLPGKRGFDLAHAARKSRVEPIVADYLTMDVDAAGTFDIVLYLGVLYHMEDPMAAMRRVRALTRGVAIIETEAVAVAGFEHRAFAEFFPPDAKLLQDPTNFWSPNAPCLAGLCKTAGFDRVEILTPPPRVRPGQAERYRLIAHATVSD